MTGIHLQALIVESIRSPLSAAQKVLAIRLPDQWLWMALVLMSVLNSIVYSISLQLAPRPSRETS